MWEGTIVFNLPNGNSKCIEDVSYVPKLTKNLLSISKLTKQNVKVEFKATRCWLKFSHSKKVVVEVVQKRMLYKLVRMTQSLVAECNTKIKKNDLWHKDSNMSICKF
jgi:disulfide oxidoreductase YuzD